MHHKEVHLLTRLSLLYLFHLLLSHLVYLSLSSRHCWLPRRQETVGVLRLICDVIILKEKTIIFPGTVLFLMAILCCYRVIGLLDCTRGTCFGALALRTQDVVECGFFVLQRRRVGRCLLLINIYQF